MLTHVAPVRASGQAADDTTEAASTKTRLERRTYRIANASSNLVTPHIGQKVEVHGTVRPARPSATVGRIPESTTQPPDPVITVRSVKMVLAECSE